MIESMYFRVVTKTDGQLVNAWEEVHPPADFLLDALDQEVFTHNRGVMKWILAFAEKLTKDEIEKHGTLRIVITDSLGTKWEAISPPDGNRSLPNQYIDR
jgi:hypothetical protein